MNTKNSILSAPYFHSEEAAYQFIEARLWPHGPVCPKCGVIGGHYKPIDKYAYNLKGADAIADCDAAIDEAMKNANKT